MLSVIVRPVLLALLSLGLLVQCKARRDSDLKSEASSDIDTSDLTRVMERLPIKEEVVAAAAAPAAQRAAYASASGQIYIYDTELSRITNTLGIQSSLKGRIFDLALSTSGQVLVATGTEGGVNVWNLETGDRFQAAMRMPSHAAAADQYVVIADRAPNEEGCEETACLQVFAFAEAEDYLLKTSATIKPRFKSKLVNDLIIERNQIVFAVDYWLEAWTFDPSLKEKKELSLGHSRLEQKKRDRERKAREAYHNSLARRGLKCNRRMVFNNAPGGQFKLNYGDCYHSQARTTKFSEITAIATATDNDHVGRKIDSFIVIGTKEGHILTSYSFVPNLYQEKFAPAHAWTHIGKRTLHKPHTKFRCQKVEEPMRTNFIGPVRSLAASHDGQFVAAGLNDGTVRVLTAGAYDKPKGVVQTIRFNKRARLASLAFLNHDYRFSIVSDGMAAQWFGRRTLKPQPFGRAQSGSAGPVKITALTTSASGQQVITGDSSGFVRQWTLGAHTSRTGTSTDFRVTAQRDLGNAAISSLSTLADSDRILVTNQGLKEITLSNEQQDIDYLSPVALPSEEPTPGAEEPGDATADMFEQAATPNRPAAAANMTTARYTADGAYILAGRTDGQVSIYARQNKELIHTLGASQRPIIGVAASKGACSSCFAYQDTLGTLWTDNFLKPKANNIPMGLQNRTLNPSQETAVPHPQQQEVSPNSIITAHKLPYIFSTLKMGGKNYVRVTFDTSSGVDPDGEEAPLKTGAVTSMQMLSDDRQLLTAELSGRLRMWDTQTCRITQSHEDPEQRHRPTALTLLPNQQFAVSGGQDGSLLLWWLKDDVNAADLLEPKKEAP